MLKLEDEVSILHKIAKEKKKDLAKMDIKTIGDLLWHFPFRYDDLSEVKKISELEAGVLATVKVTVTKIRVLRSWKKKMMITEINATDNEGELQAIWFRQKYVSQILKVGDQIYLNGKPEIKNNTWLFSSPNYEKVKAVNIHSARLVPIYHTSGKLSQKQLRFLINLALKQTGEIDDPLPVDLLNKEDYPWLYQALQSIHFPEDQNDFAIATQRLKFQELFYLQCKYQLAKKSYVQYDTWPMNIQEKTLQQIMKSLPFKLSNDQIKVLKEILLDLEREQPMNRLVEGDVGSGKTIVAILAALNTISQKEKLQVAFMAPTEILAWQHFENIKKLLPEKYLEKIAFLSKDRQYFGHDLITKQEALANIKSAKAQIVIGTHSLIQEKINFKKLALVIIDEQHRFGVKQRQALKQSSTGRSASGGKNTSRVPHLLSLTATPIPRTLALTLYGDLDISLIQEKPQGRKDVKTLLVPERKRLAAYKFIQEKIDQKQQVFIICPLIDESDKLGYKSVQAEHKKLNEKIFPDLEIGLLHGKLKSAEKEDLMKRFKNNQFPILVATSVIEVGVDIPNATIMMIESAERFGLSQLHQFRGRVGRNSLASWCLLFTTDDSHLNKERLKALEKTNNGFELAELDLQLRGSGEIFGTKQTGLLKLKIANLHDTKLIKKAQDWAKKIVYQEKYLSNHQLQKLLLDLKTEMHLE
ncbi:ATP-dependent DNA helicase RecG [Candidatus Nomurabacteria bacterium]|nr:ATP-dependent DNA helicase RecG [Candidatus Nomurabacteria bacterium]